MCVGWERHTAIIQYGGGGSDGPITGTFELLVLINWPKKVAGHCEIYPPSSCRSPCVSLIHKVVVGHCLVNNHEASDELLLFSWHLESWWNVGVTTLFPGDVPLKNLLRFPLDAHEWNRVFLCCEKQKVWFNAERWTLNPCLCGLFHIMSLLFFPPAGSVVLYMNVWAGRDDWFKSPTHAPTPESSYVQYGTH